MVEALTDAVLRADFGEMTDDLKVTFVYNGETVSGTFDPISSEPLQDFAGFLNDVQFAVWVPLGGSDGLSSTPRTAKACTVDGTEYQIMQITDRDNVCCKVYLGALVT